MEIPKLERVTAEELAVLHALRSCDAEARALLADLVERYARKQLEKLPSNILRLQRPRADA